VHLSPPAARREHTIPLQGIAEGKPSGTARQRAARRGKIIIEWDFGCYPT
jgi:hypothetical protein